MSVFQRSEPVSTLPEGAHARIDSLDLSPRVARRLLALGLRPGIRVQVFQRRAHGFVLAVGPTRVAVGADLASRLWVVRESDSEAPVTHGAAGARSRVDPA
jgi:Fe2+ transport system protein FeoA